MSGPISLDAGDGSLVWEPRANGPPLWRHFGPRVAHGNLPLLGDTRTAASYSLDDDVPFSTAPPFGLGWFGPAMVQLRRNGLALPVQFMTAAVEAESSRVRVVSTDTIAGVELEQEFAAVGDAFVCRSIVRNIGSDTFDVDWLASVLLPLPASAREIVSWRGRHNAELLECCEPMPEQAWQREVRRGVSGHGGPPGLLLLDEGATYHAGTVRGLQLAWSGDSRVAVERDDEGFWTLSAGALLQPGEVRLGTGESWQAPEAIVAVSTSGRNGVASAFRSSP